ncbi:fatty acid-binding protein [Elysia marginata]|uniref:Fatty acid-binding protein n=1 Tax=Elysia marginata TaxID=1093978 RepID=A0AAV4JC58_9GAST|nr:fatty acid-binding protein [Elysia marginata]
MDAIVGTWKNKKGSEENMNAFMDACKIPENMRQVFLERQYEITYSKDPSNANKLKTTVKVTNDSKLPAIEYEYELGKEFESNDIDGKHFKCTISWDGQKFVERYVDAKNTEMFIHRELTPDGQMKFAMTCCGVTSSSVWVKS